MNCTTITLCYRKIFDASSTQHWEKKVFEDSYKEFKMQAQYFNPDKKYTTFAELIHHVQGAQKLHFLVSAAVIGYILPLNECIPDIVNILGKQFLSFKNFQFEIINSDINNSSKHRVAINFYSEPLKWHYTIDKYLLVTDKNQTGRQLNTHLFQLQPFLSIHMLEKE